MAFGHDPFERLPGARGHEAAQGVSELHGPARAIGQQRPEAATGYHKPAGVLHCPDPGRAGAIVKQGKLTHELAGPYCRDHRIVVTRNARGDLQQARFDKVECIGMIALPKQHFTCANGERQGIAQQCFPSLAIEPGKLRRCLRSLSHPQRLRLPRLYVNRPRQAPATGRHRHSNPLRTPSRRGSASPPRSSAGRWQCSACHHLPAPLPRFRS